MLWMFTSGSSQASGASAERVLCVVVELLCIDSRQLDADIRVAENS